MGESCRCDLPVDPLDGPHWWPRRDPEPDPAVRVVAQHGQAPAALRFERVPGGWKAHGYLTCHPTHTPPRPWERVGQCWAGTEHPVEDATTAAPRERSPLRRTGTAVEPRT